MVADSEEAGGHRMKGIKQVLAAAVIMGMSAALLGHFLLIWCLRQYLIQEPDKAILITETALLITILGFGIYLFIEALKVRR